MRTGTLQMGFPYAANMKMRGNILLGVVGFLQVAALVLSTKVQELHREELPELSLASRFQTYGKPRAECPEFPEPKVPNKLPAWVKTLQSDEYVQEIQSNTGAFIKGNEIVLTDCTFTAVQAVLEHVKPCPNCEHPQFGDLYECLECEDRHPVFDIYFGCGTKKYVIPVSETMVLGRSGNDESGTYRLIAPLHNIEFRAQKILRDSRRRIMMIQKGAHVTLHGFIFRDGRQVDMVTGAAEVAVNRWSGSAVLANVHSTLVVHRCKFIANASRSRFVRQASGGAIMAETGSRLYVWGCLFSKNQATNGGAIAASSARTVHIARCTFDQNVVRGGYDPSRTKVVNGVNKPVLQIRGGAIRVDSVKGYDSGEPHVVVCNSIFTRNRLKMTDAQIKEFGYNPEEAGFLFAGASGLAVWNKPNVLQLENGDRNLLTMKGCTFNQNKEILPWDHHRAGRYVFEARGAGHIKVEDSVFNDNKSVFSVVGLDNSKFFKDFEDGYKLTLKNLKFRRNDVASSDGVWTAVRFPPKRFGMTCTSENVEFLTDGIEQTCHSLYKDTP